MKLSKIFFILAIVFSFYFLFIFFPFNLSNPSTQAAVTFKAPVSPLPTVTFLPLVKSTPSTIVVNKNIEINSFMDSVSSEIFNGINDFRKSKGLSVVVPNSSVCSFAEIRAVEIVNNFNHDGFQKRAEFHSLPYANYSLAVENIAMNPNFSDVVLRWIQSPGHAENMLVSVTYGCVGKSGEYYVYEGVR